MSNNNNKDTAKRSREAVETSDDAVRHLEEPSSSVSTLPKPPRAPQPSAHYFAVDDIVWVRPAGHPYWPGEVRTVDPKTHVITCQLFSPPSSLLSSRAEESDVSETPTSSSVVTTSPVVIISSPAKKLFFFDKLHSEEELLQCIEDRLQRKQHNVSAYEFAFVEAVRRANSLVRITLSPALLKPFEICGVGVVHSFMRTHTSAPRQPSTKEFVPQTAVIQLKPGLENAVRDLMGFERIWVVFQFSYAVGLKNDRQGADRSTGWKTMVVPPRDTVLRGVFATRSPHRPNFIGLSCVRLLAVKGLEIHIADHDLLHGTPVLDVKPYLPFCDAHPLAKAGWVEELDTHGQPLGDHRGTTDLSIAVHRNYEQSSTVPTKHA